jgi:ferredoxin-nitrite reductase
MLPDTDIVKKYITYENGFLTNLVACAGTAHCPFGVIANKPDAIELAEYLHKSVKYTKPVRMYWSACPKGCGIHACGDIGFVGTKKAVDGKVELAVDIYMGGKLSGEGEEGRLYQKGVLLKDLKETVANLPIFE